jgi:AraC-like DNA-binding protein
MLSKLLQTANLFHLLFSIDSELSAIKRSAGCPYCGGPLHQSNYTRQPRGGPVGLPEEYCLRRSLCCGRDGCRRRSAPESCLFMGRRVYWRCVVLVATALMQRRAESLSIGQLSRRLCISRKTIMRWFNYFIEVFGSSFEWLRIRGFLPATVSNECLPVNFLEYCIMQSRDTLGGLAVCCRLLGRGG